jgi:pimeloyl-ACP methyl ester carboxylesterase
MTGIIRRSAAGVSYLASESAGAVPMVLLHGIGSNAASFEPLMAALDGSYPTLAWDAPGYGQSQPLAVEWPDASDYAAVLNRLLDHLQIGRCIVVGHSLGNLVAGRYACQAAKRVAALVLICPAIGYGAKKGAPLPPAVVARLEELDRLGAEKFAAKRAPGLVANPSGQPEVLSAVAAAMAAVRRPGYDQAARMLAGGRLIDDARRIEVPAAVITAAEDRITPPESGHFLYAALQQSSPRHAFRIIANAGHAVCHRRSRPRWRRPLPSCSSASRRRPPERPRRAAENHSTQPEQPPS